MERGMKAVIAIVTCLFLVCIAWFIIELHEMSIDHMCYMMDDETFYNEPMCKKYWEYRRQ